MTCNRIAFAALLLLILSFQAKAQAPYPLPPPEQQGETLESIHSEPYFSDERYQAMQTACDQNDLEQCVTQTETALAAEQDDDQKRRLSFLLGLRAFEAQQMEKAEQTFLQINGSYSLLQGYIAYYLGEIQYQSYQWQQALDWYQQVPLDSRIATQARFRIASCRSKLNDPDARMLLELILKNEPTHFRSTQARYELAEILGEADARQAKRLYLEVQAAEPFSGFGKLAQTHMLERNFIMTPKDQAELMTAQARTYIDQFRYREANRLLQKGLKQLKRHESAPYYAHMQFEHARAYFKRRHYSKAIPLFEAIQKKAADAQLQGEAAYLQIDAHLRKGETEKAIALAKRFPKENPNHKRSCAVRSLLGKAYKESDQDELALQAYQSLIDNHKTCGHLPDAMWYVGWMQYKNKHYEKALASFSTIKQNDFDRFETERASYWIGRVHLLQNQRENAISQWTTLVKEYPLGYYSSLAAQRLQELGAPLPEEFLALQKAEQADKPLANALDISIKPYLYMPHFRRGMELLRLGRNSEAKREFQALEKGFPKDQNLVSFLAYLYYLNGNVSRSVYFFRTRLDDFARNYPSANNDAIWKLAYPRPFKGLTEVHCKVVGLDPLLLNALMREESSFDPEIESFAHATGLTQIMYSTGRYIARRLKVKQFRKSDLTNPDIAIRFGSFYLEELIDKFKGNHALAISSYNGGETAVRRWLREHGERPMDEFIEDIPYRETRRYTRRVLKSYGIYRHLYGDGATGFGLWKTTKQK